MRLDATLIPAMPIRTKMTAPRAMQPMARPFTGA